MSDGITESRRTVREPKEEPYTVDLSSTETPDEIWVPSANTYDPNPQREQVRGTIAWFLLGIFLLTILFAFIALAYEWTEYDNIKDMLGILLPPITGLVGSAIGFYFGRGTD